MGSPFDHIESTCFNVSNAIFGYKVEWTPTTPDGAAKQTGKGLYKEPTKQFSIMTIDFQITDESLEYKLGDFPELFTLANKAASEEKVTIFFKSGTREFFVRKVVKKYDGDTFVAKLDPVEE